MWILLSSGSNTDPTSWTQLGVTGIVAATWFLVASKLWIDNRQKDARINELQQARIADRDTQFAREQERLERVLPLLQQTANVLATVPDRFDRAIGEAQSASRAIEVDDLIRQMRLAVLETKEAAARLDRKRGS